MKHPTPTLFFTFFLIINTGWVSAQNLDSLLNNKRIYTAVNIGDKALPKIDGVLDDEIWSLGEWQGGFTQQQPVGGVEPTEQTFVKVLYDY